MDYEKILKEALNNEDTDYEVKRWLEIHFPELAESEDEKIRKYLIGWVSKIKPQVFAEDAGLKKDNVIAWLEKQGEKKPVKFKPSFRIGDMIKPKDPVLGEPRIIEKIHPKWGYDTSKGILDFEFEDNWELVEQKPVEWSEEDETTKNNISHIIRQYDKISKRENQPCYYVGDCLLWMQNIKDRVQSKQEWSDEDEDMYHLIMSDVNYAQKQYPTSALTPYDKKVDWLKSLRPQKHWKPTEEQMDTLAKAVEDSLGKDYHNQLSLLEYDIKNKVLKL